MIVWVDGCRLCGRAAAGGHYLTVETLNRFFTDFDVKRGDILEPYNVKIITYPDMTKQVRIYSETIGKDEFVYPRPHRKGRRKKVHNEFDDQLCDLIDKEFDEYFDHVRETSMKRTRSKVYNYAKCNDWEWFVTFTFNSEKVDRYDYDSCTKKLTNWFDRLRRFSPGLSYVVVPEHHKDGAWHFHGLFAGLNDSEIVWTGKHVIKKVCKKGCRTRFVRTDQKIYKIGRYRLGWMTATKIQDKQKVISYITKYITKDMMAGLSGKKRYWASKNLLLPTEETALLDSIGRFVLAGELQEDCSYHKVSQCNTYMTQRVEIFDLL